jgi:hypothetical protein
MLMALPSVGIIALGTVVEGLLAHFAGRMELVQRIVCAVARLISGSRAGAPLNPLRSQVHVNASSGSATTRR